MAYQFTDANFDQEVLNADVPVLVDFWAPWCGPCRMLGPTIDELAARSQGDYKVGKVNVDENQQLAIKYNIHSIPTMLVFKNGEVVKQLVGLQDQDQLARALQAA